MRASPTAPLVRQACPGTRTSSSRDGWLPHHRRIAHAGQGYRSPFDATVVAKLAAQGMVTLGKLNCDEFAMGSVQRKRRHCRRGPNASAPRCATLGQSPHPRRLVGGSACAVAARHPGRHRHRHWRLDPPPASFCGITGIKPTYGRASRYGMMAFASSLDQAGPMARSAQDCALLLSALCGPDLDRDSTSLDVPAEDFTLKLNDSIGSAHRHARSSLARVWRMTCVPPWMVRSSSMSNSAPAGAHHVAAHRAVHPGVSSSPRPRPAQPVRFDGVKFGHRARTTATWPTCTKKTRAEGFGDEVKRRIMIGTYVLSHGYYDAYYLQAQKIRRMIADDFQNAFKDCDLIAGPVAPPWLGNWARSRTRWPTTWPTSLPCPVRWRACPA